MHVLAVANLKGGVGKSTIAAALAVRACADFGRVAVVDLDAQQSLAYWFKAREMKDRPEVFAGEESPAQAVEKLRLAGWDIVILDTPPNFFDLVTEAVTVAACVIVPLRPSPADLHSTVDMVALVQDAGRPMMAVLNDAVKTDKTVETTRGALIAAKVAVADTVLHHRVSHVRGFAVGKSAAEVNGGRDKEASAEIDALWREIAKAARIKVKRGGQ